MIVALSTPGRMPMFWPPRPAAATLRAGCPPKPVAPMLATTSAQTTESTNDRSSTYPPGSAHESAQHTIPDGGNVTLRRHVPFVNVASPGTLVGGEPVRRDGAPKMAESVQMHTQGMAPLTANGPALPVSCRCDDLSRR